MTDEEKNNIPDKDSSFKKNLPTEYGGYKGMDPTTHGDWQHKGRVTDF